MRSNKLRELLKADQPSLGTHIHTTWPSIVEAIGHSGMFDYVEFVGEYAPYSLYDLDNLARAAELHDMSMMIKVEQEPNHFLAQRAVGSGFHSVLFADCRTVDDVKRCIAAVRPDTPEDGGSFGAVSRRMTYMSYGGNETYVQNLRDIVVVIMIEKDSLVEQLEDVLAIPGVDMIQWGGVDYAMSVGKPGQARSPEIQAVGRKVFETAIKMGVPPRAEIGRFEQARDYIDMGVKHFCIGTDIAIIYQWMKEQGGGLRDLLQA